MRSQLLPRRCHLHQLFALFLGFGASGQLSTLSRVLAVLCSLFQLFPLLSATIAALIASTGPTIGGMWSTEKNLRLKLPLISDDHAYARLARGWPDRSKTWTTPFQTV